VQSGPDNLDHESRLSGQPIPQSCKGSRSEGVGRGMGRWELSEAQVAGVGTFQV
jgi:hypothetical protein